LKFFQDVVAGTVVVTNASCCVVSTGISAALVTSVAVGAIHGDVVVVVVVVVVVNGNVARTDAEKKMLLLRFCRCRSKKECV
jgi:hypothetical protein